MIRIAHRGNYRGRDQLRENSPDYIEEALLANYDVEIDVWLSGTNLLLGHDSPIIKIPNSFVVNKHIWCHSKTLETHIFLCRLGAHCFFHDKEQFVFTNYGIKWSSHETHDGILVMPEYNKKILAKLQNRSIRPMGICSDDFTNFEKN